MARLLVNDEWYDGLATNALYESEYEKLVQRHAPNLFAGWQYIPFKTSVASPSGIGRPDGALVDYEYRSWWVVEVELAHHSLEGHVLPQVEVFRTGNYEQSHADALAEHSDLDQSLLREMVKGSPPRVLIVVNLPSPDWRKPLKARGSLLSVVEVFRSKANKYSLRLNGEQPLPPTDVVSVCRRHPLLSGMFVVESPAALIDTAGQFDEPIFIDLDGQPTEWQRWATADEVFLRPARVGGAFIKQKVLRIVRLPDGRLAFDS